MEEPMSNTMKFILRTLLIVLLMVAGSWLAIQINIYAAASGNLKFLASIAMYIVYFIIGVTLGSMVTSRFTKPKNKFLCLFPILIFVIIGVTQLLFWLVPSLPLIGWIVKYLSQFTYLSWTLTGVFTALAFR